MVRGFAVTSILAGIVMLAWYAVRVEASPPADEKQRDASVAPPNVAAKDKPPEKAETLNFAGTATDKKTGKAIAGAAVTVSRIIVLDEGGGYRSVETSHKTDAAGKYNFTVPPEQSSKPQVRIEVNVEHPDYAPIRFGDWLESLRKASKPGARSLFDATLSPGQQITGRVVEAGGKPVAGVIVRGQSVVSRRGQEPEQTNATCRTDEQGRFRLTLLTRESALLTFVPEKYLMLTHRLPPGNPQRDQGLFTLQPGVRLRGKVLDLGGKPAAGVYVNAVWDSRLQPPPPGVIPGLPVMASYSRSATTNEKGEFLMGPLPPGICAIGPAEYPRDDFQEVKERIARPLPDVFVTRKIQVTNDPVEIRAVPSIVLEAMCMNSRGVPEQGLAFLVNMRLDEYPFQYQARSDVKGRLFLRIPRGLAGNISMFKVGSPEKIYRWRKNKEDEWQHTRQIIFGPLNADSKGIEIVGYTAPKLVIEAVGKDGKPLQVGGGYSFEYEKARKPRRLGQPNLGKTFELVGSNTYPWEVTKLFPDEEVTLTFKPDQHKSQSIKLKLAEGETKRLKLTFEKFD